MIVIYSRGCVRKRGSDDIELCRRGEGVSDDWAPDADVAEVITEVVRWPENENDAFERGD